jgi:hypothetical protein
VTADLPRIEPGVPDQEGTPGFYLHAPTLDDRFTAALRGSVPEHALAWSAKPAAWWIAEEYRDVVRELAMAFFGGLIEDDGSPGAKIVWIPSEEVIR